MSNDAKNFEEKIYKVLKMQSKKCYVIDNNKLKNNNDLDLLKKTPEFKKAKQYKNTHNKILKKNILQFDFSGKGFDIRSICRGDILINKNNKIIILDCKNYEKINSKLHTSNDISPKTHIKTMEIHLRNLILCEHFKEIFNFNLKSFIQGKVNNKYIHKNDLVNLIKTLEFGFINQVSDIVYNKFFISKKKKSLLISEFSFNNIPQTVKMRSKKWSEYYYIQFMNEENDILYEISMRSRSQGNFKANTSSIHKSLLKIKEVHQTIDLINFFDNYKIEKNIRMPKKYYIDGFQYIKIMENVDSDNLATYLYNYHKIIINQLNPDIPKNKIIQRIKQDLNPKFKSLCKQSNINYCNKTKLYSFY